MRSFLARPGLISRVLSISTLILFPSFLGTSLAQGAENTDAREGAEIDQLRLANTARTVDTALASLARFGGTTAQQPCANGLDLGARRGTYVSGMLGGGHASEGGSLQNRALEIRLGTPLKDGMRLDFVHDNEGHPLNNHRDGFAVQAVIEKSLGSRLRIEAGAGPYFSMNTTTKSDGRELDEKRMGLLASAAVLVYLDEIDPGLHIRAGYNHVVMPGAPSTDSFLIGLGKEFGSVRVSPIQASGQGPLELALLGGDSKTNHGSTSATRGFQIEVRKPEAHDTATSVSYLQEGGDSRVNRSGVAVQKWYLFRTDGKWTFSAGAGPYVSHDRLNSGKTELNGLISLQAERQIGPEKNGTSLLVRFSRIASPSSNDKDLGFAGVIKKF